MAVQLRRCFLLIHFSLSGPTPLHATVAPPVSFINKRQVETGKCRSVCRRLVRRLRRERHQHAFIFFHWPSFCLLTIESFVTIVEKKRMAIKPIDAVGRVYKCLCVCVCVCVCVCLCVCVCVCVCVCAEAAEAAVVTSRFAFSRDVEKSAPALVVC